MAKQVTLSTVLAEVKKGSKKLDTIDKRLSSVEKDMKRVLKCVSHENADFEIKVTRSKGSKGGGSRPAIPIAAKSS